MQRALARRIAAYVEESPTRAEVLDLLAKFWGRSGIRNLTRIFQLAQSQMSHDTSSELIADDWVSKFRKSENILR